MVMVVMMVVVVVYEVARSTERIVDVLIALLKMADHIGQ